jgi:hypothetical protein
MVRLLILMLRALTSRSVATAGARESTVPAAESRRSTPARRPPPEPGDEPPTDPGPPRPRFSIRRIPRWVRWTVIIAVIVAVFRRAAVWLVLTALSGALHLIGINVHLPNVKFGWPWQSATSGTTQTVIVGPWVLQKIEGIDKPALGTENFNFLFTHKVSHDIGPWPCWYQASFYTVGHASATVDLNPGSAWWKPGTGHYSLTVTQPPVKGKVGQVTVAMALPDPQLPQSVHDITIDDTLSQPVDVQHSWTYPGLGCGVLLKPQFSPSALYPLAQQEAFQRATTDPSVTAPMIHAAEAEAVKIIRDNFIQPTVNALGYKLTSFTLRWVSAK